MRFMGSLTFSATQCLEHRRPGPPKRAGRPGLSLTYLRCAISDVREDDCEEGRREFAFGSIDSGVGNLFTVELSQLGNRMHR